MPFGPLPSGLPAAAWRAGAWRSGGHGSKSRRIQPLKSTNTGAAPTPKWDSMGFDHRGLVF